MMSFVISEIKMAVIWVKETLVRLSAWIFRWVLRWAMLAGIFLLLAKGCEGVWSVAGPFVQSEKKVPATGASPQASQTSGVTSVQNSSALPENYYTKVSVPDEKESLPEKARSAWSTLRYISGDLMRWFKRR